MKIGLLFPQTEIGPNRGGVRAYAQAALSLGFTHLVSYEHVLGAAPERLPKDYAPYGLEDEFHEVLTLYAYLAGVAPGLGLATGVLVLPQRQTALVAKQAAQLALLTEGGFRLGVGIGWNYAEFGGLGMDFATRARRFEEQIALLRQLWTQPVVNFAGTFEEVEGCGIRPLPERPDLDRRFGRSRSAPRGPPGRRLLSLAAAGGRLAGHSGQDAPVALRSRPLLGRLWNGSTRHLQTRQQLARRS